MSIWQKPCKCHHTCEVTINNILFSVVFSFFPLKTVFPHSLFPASSSSLSSSTLFQIFFPVSLSAFCPLLVISHFVSLSIQFHAAIVFLSHFFPYLSCSLSLSLSIQFIFLFPQVFSRPQASNLSNLYESSPPPPPLHLCYCSPLLPSSLSSSSVGDPELVCVCGVREMLLSVMLNQEWTLRGKLTHREIKLLYSLHLNHF